MPPSNTGMPHRSYIMKHVELRSVKNQIAFEVEFVNIC